MAAPTRASIVKGPGTVQLGAAGPVFYSPDAFESEFIRELKELRNEVHGRVGRYITDKYGTTPLTPVGCVTAAHVAALYPHQNPTIGADIFGSTDTACIVHSKAGKKVTWTSSAIFKMPDLTLSPMDSMIGQFEIRHLLKTGGDSSSAADYYAVATEAFSDTSFATANDVRLKYGAAWGSTFASIEAQAGWKCSFEMELEPLLTQHGTITYYLKGVTAVASCIPLNLSESDLLDNLAAEDIGEDVTKNDLVITGAGGAVVVTLKDAALQKGPLRYGSTVVRAGEVAFVAHRDESAGTFGALFSIAIS